MTPENRKLAEELTVLISAEEIQNRVRELAKQIADDYLGKRYT